MTTKIHSVQSSHHFYPYPKQRVRFEYIPVGGADALCVYAGESEVQFGGASLKLVFSFDHNPDDSLAAPDKKTRDGIDAEVIRSMDSLIEAAVKIRVAAFRRLQEREAALDQGVQAQP